MDLVTCLQAACTLLLALSSWILARASKQLDELDERVRRYGVRLAVVETKLDLNRRAGDPAPAHAAVR